MAIVVVILSVLLVSIAGAISGAISGENSGLGSGSSSGEGLASASTSSWEQFKKFVLLNEGGTRVDKNKNNDSSGEYYIVENDSKNNPTIGHGLCLKASNMYLNVELFSKYDIDSKKMADNYFNGIYDIVSVEICDEIWNEILYSKYQSVISTCNGLNLTEYQILALTDVMYRRGNINGFVHAYNSLWNESDNNYEGDFSSERYSMDTLYSFFNNGYTDNDGVYTRKKRQWLLFKYGYYQGLGEYYIESSSAADISSLNTADYKGTYQSVTNGYTFVEYYQSGASWSNERLNGGSSNYITIGNSGCHVTSLAIALTAITGETITPRDINKAFNFMTNDDTAILDTDEFSHLKNSVNIGDVITSGLSEELLISNLNAGKILIIRFQGSCEWTQSTHYVICADYKKENDAKYIYISNPARNGPSGWIEISRITIKQWTQVRPISQK